MATSNLWYNFMVDPQLVNRESIGVLSDKEIFDLLVYLIYNSIQVNTYLVSFQTNDETQKKNLNDGYKKLNKIKFLIFKILAYIKWDLKKIVDNLPTVHQEFVFLEFQKFCEQENDCFKSFSSILYHLWVLRFEIKSIYPGKGNFKISNVNLNQNIQDPYHVSIEVQDNLIKKIQNNCIHSLNELEKYVKQIEEKSIDFDIHVFTFDCFMIDIDESRLILEKAIKLETNKFLDETFYELALWHYYHENYSRAHDYFLKIKLKSSFEDLDGYVMVTKGMTFSKTFKPEPKSAPETLENKIANFLISVLKNHTNVYDFDWKKLKDDKKVMSILKKLAENYRESRENSLFQILNKYIILRTSSNSYESDLKNKSIAFDTDSDLKNQDDNEIIEEGEIEEESIIDDDHEIALLQATDPSAIINLIPSIKRPLLMINAKWSVPTYDQILSYSNHGQIDLHKCHIVLAKANELRNAKFLSESRDLYLYLLEDVQTSNLVLADMIRNELLQIDLEKYFSNFKEINVQELESRCLTFLRNQNKQNFLFFKELTETVCLFLLEINTQQYPEFLNHQIDVVRFSACLAHVARNLNARDGKCKELWDFCLGCFILPTSKYANNFYKPVFFVSFANFVERFERNFKVINVLSTCLIKLYSMIKEYHSQIVVTAVCAKFDVFPSTIPPNLLASIDHKLVSVTIDQMLRSYLAILPKEIYLIRYYAEFLLSESLHAQAMKHFLQILLYNTDCFSHFDYLDSSEAPIKQLITCASKMGYHVLSGILHQLSPNPDYGIAFKQLSHFNCTDSSDDLYECIWDVMLLEFLINFHNRRGEEEQKQKVIRLVSQLDINSNNSPSILNEAANLRKTKLFLMLIKQFM